MGKRILVTSGLVIALVVAGQAVFTAVFADDEAAPTGTNHSGTNDSLAGDSLKEVGAEPPAPVVPAQQNRITVVSVDGKVERRYGDTPWLPVQKGETLREDEAIRTDDDAEAVLDIADRATVSIYPGSQFAVDEIAKTVALVRLDQGRIGAIAHGRDGAKLRVQTRGSDAQAETEMGEFSVAASGEGDLVVATKTGRVLVSAKDGSVEVLPGQLTISRRDGTPSPPAAVPESLFLKVKSPIATVQRQKSTRIEGRSSPGAVVSVNQTRLVAGPDGTFATDVALQDGKNVIRVEARGIDGGSEAVELPPIHVKSKISSARSTNRWESP